MSAPLRFAVGDRCLVRRRSDVIAGTVAALLPRGAVHPREAVVRSGRLELVVPVHLLDVAMPYPEAP